MKDITEYYVTLCVKFFRLPSILLCVCLSACAEKEPAANKPEEAFVRKAPIAE